MLVKLSSWKSTYTSIPTSSNHRHNGKKEAHDSLSSKVNVSLWNVPDNEGINVCINTSNTIQSYTYKNDTLDESRTLNYEISPNIKTTFTNVPLYDEANGILYASKNKTIFYWKDSTTGPSADLHVILPCKITSIYLHQSILVGLLENGQLFQGKVMNDVLNITLLTAIDTNISNGGTLLYGYVMDNDESRDTMVVVFITQCITGGMIVSKYLLQIIGTTAISSYTRRKKVRKSEEKEEKKEDEYLHHYSSAITTSSSLILNSNHTILTKFKMNHVQLCQVTTNTIFLLYTLEEKDWYGCNITVSTTTISQPFYVTKCNTIPSIFPLSSSNILLYNYKTLQIINVFHETCLLEQEVSDMKVVSRNNCICFYNVKQQAENSIVTLKCCNVYNEECNISFSDALLQSRKEIEQEYDVDKILESYSAILPKKNGIIASTTTITQEQMKELINISDFISKQQEEEYISILLYLLQNKAFSPIDELLSNIIFNTTISTYSTLQIIDTILSNNTINEYSIVLMMYYFIKDGTDDSFESSLQSFSNINKNLLELSSHWIYKIITSVLYPTNTALVSCAMKAIFTSKSSKITFFQILCFTLQERKQDKHYESMIVYLNILLDAFRNDYLQNDEVMTKIRYLKRELIDKRCDKFCSVYRYHLNHFVESDERIGRKRKYSEEFRDCGYDLEYLLL